MTLSGQGITDISALSSLNDLTEVDLLYTYVYDYSPLIENKGIGKGDKVWLTLESSRLAKVLDARGVLINPER